MTTPGGDRTGSPAPWNTEADASADVSFSQSTLQVSATLTSNDAAIMQREREITDIAKGIIELADIFQELQTMVIDQGTLLDRIDYNVEQLAVNVREADKEMTVVSTSLGMRRARTNKLAGFGISAKINKAQDYVPFDTNHTGHYHIVGNKAAR